MHGEQSALDTIRSSAEFMRLLTRAGAIVDTLGIVSAFTGDALGTMMGIFGETSQQLPQQV